MTANGIKGIGNMRGCNSELPPPIILSIAANIVTGMASPEQKIELFKGEINQRSQFIGSVTTDSAGNLRFLLPDQLPSMPYLLVTSTDTSGSTSEFSKPFNTTMVENPQSFIPNEFVLQQNYPNPFNPTTTVGFSIPTREFVTLKVYDILGKEGMTLVNEVKPAGNYVVNINAANLSTGVYFYKLAAKGFLCVKK